MTKITSSRLAEVFRLLGQNKIDTAPSGFIHKKEKKNSTSSVCKHDPEVLKVKLINRLAKLSKDTDTFEYNAAQIMVEEVLLWEFGDEILTVSAYKSVKDSLVDTLLNTPRLHSNLQASYKNLLK